MNTPLACSCLSSVGLTRGFERSPLVIQLNHLSPQTEYVTIQKRIEMDIKIGFACSCLSNVSRALSSALHWSSNSTIFARKLNTKTHKDILK